MVSKVNCVAILGIDTLPISVETDMSNGLPSFDMVGLLSSDIKESRERVRTAIKNSGFLIPPKRITINLSPANVRKSGTYFDLAIAISILKSIGNIPRNLDKMLFAGELSLDGKVVKVNGILPIVLCAVKEGIEVCFVPKDNVKECCIIDGIKIIGVDNLNELIFLLSQEDLSDYCCRCDKYELKPKSLYDFKDIKGQQLAKMAAEIAVAGMHNMIMVGPPGTGKTILARAIPSIMPKMSRQQQLEISIIHSIAGDLENGMILSRPFRNPHHTVTVSAMTGGGLNPKPGEITLAHGGCLFMDEFPEFSRDVLEILRQPMEDEKIVISRVGGKYIFPASFMLVASMNPCKCGYYPDRNRCNCTEMQVNKYLSKVSGPILDRMDISVEMNRVEFKDLNNTKIEESSEEIRKRVDRAAQIQCDRYANEQISFNSQLRGELIGKYCKLGPNENKMMEHIYSKFDLSVRGYEKILKVARTIADLECREDISQADISKALAIRLSYERE